MTLLRPLLAFLLIFLIGITQAQDFAQAKAEGRKIIEAVQAETEIPGLSVSVSHKGVLVWSEGFGYADLEAKKPVDPSTTLFRIGSVSKPLTAAAIGVLVEENKLDVDKIVQEYVPAFPEKKYPITTRLVAGHLAGIRHYRGNEFLSAKHYATVSEGLKIFDKDPLLFEPGTDYSYSSYGWNLISAVIEGASKEPFLEFMQREVFDKIGMHNTHPDFANREVANRTKFYLLDNGQVKEAPYVDNSYKWAGGGFIATSEDLIKFGNAYMKPGYQKQETMQLLLRPQLLKDGSSRNYGMGWRYNTDEKGKTWYGHTGGSVGGITRLVIYPKEEIVVSIVTNSSNVEYRNAEHKIAWLFMDEE